MHYKTVWENKTMGPDGKNELSMYFFLCCGIIYLVMWWNCVSKVIYLQCILFGKKRKKWRKKEEKGKKMLCSCT